MTTATPEATSTGRGGGLDETPAHILCRLCYPEGAAPFVKAVCGHELLGVDASPDSPLCEGCAGDWIPHLQDHGYDFKGYDL